MPTEFDKISMHKCLDKKALSVYTSNGACVFD